MKKNFLIKIITLHGCICKCSHQCLKTLYSYFHHRYYHRSLYASHSWGQAFSQQERAKLAQVIPQRCICQYHGIATVVYSVAAAGRCVWVQLLTLSTLTARHCSKLQFKKPKIPTLIQRQPLKNIQIDMFPQSFTKLKKKLV